MKLDDLDKFKYEQLDVQKKRIIDAGIKMALDEIDDCIIILDSMARFIYVNKAAEKLDSLKFDEFIGRGIIDVYDIDEETSLALKGLIKGDSIKNTYQTYTTKFGKKVSAISSVQPIVFEDEVAGIVCHVKDVSRLLEIYENIYYQQNEVRDSGTNNYKYPRFTFNDIVGESEDMKKAISLSKIAAQNSLPVLLCGETGTGKELFAQSIHNASPVREKAFVAVNCAAIPGNLLESMLFGTTKGSFTGAIDQEGLLQAANGGTLFLDELNSMDMTLQSKLLRVIEEQRFRKVGGAEEIMTSFRIISSISEDPYKAIDNGSLRNDLFFRLGAIIVNLPPLRDRVQDLLCFINHFINNKRRNYKNISISKEAIDLLCGYEWPGNNRELNHALEFATNINRGSGTIKPEHMPDYLISHAEKVKRNYSGKLETQIGLFERDLIIDTLKKTNGRVTDAARILGIKRQSLEYRLKKHNISNRKVDVK